MPNISIVMGTYNGERFLRQQLDSLASQSLLPAELVVTDDLSTDGTMEILEGFVAISPFPVRIHRNESNLGFRANFIKCANSCSSELIAFCDQDDVWDPEKLKLQNIVFDDSSVMMVHHNAVLISPDGNDLGRLMWPRMKQVPIIDRMGLPPLFNIPGFSQVFRREVLIATPAWSSTLSPEHPNTPLVHDQFVTFVANAIGKVAYIDKPLVRYRQHDSNALGWTGNVPSLFDRIRYKMENRNDVFVLAEKSAAAKSEALARMSEVLENPLKEFAEDASRQWADLAELYARRRLTYSGRFAARIRSLAQIASKGAYSSRGNWTFSAKSLVKDLLLGVALGPMTIRYGIKPSRSEGDWTCRRGR